MGEPVQGDDEHEEEAPEIASFRKKFEGGGRRLSSDIVAEAMDLAFPDFACLRCGNKEFIVGLTHGVIGFHPKNRFASDSRTAFVCARCGMVENHSPIALIAGLLKIPLESE